MSGGPVRLPVHRPVDKRRGVNVADFGQFDQETRQRLAAVFKTRTRDESAEVFAGTDRGFGDVDGLRRIAVGA